MRFLPKAGKHRQGKCRLWDRNSGKESRPDTIHQFVATDPKNNIVESEIDLVERFGRGTFERLPDEPKANGKAKAK
ncbi:MAG: hypothetical protein IID44_09885 [Planctomycetes bacterium]|nr:hypothetical protein [Planctomycetota bacterium]